MRLISMDQIGEISEEEVLAAAREFAAVLAEAQEYRALEAAQATLGRDEAAQAGLRAFHAKQRELGWQVRFGLAGEAAREGLERTERAVLEQPAVRALVEAQERLSQLCREVADLISEVLGLSFAASCGPECSCEG